MITAHTDKKLFGVYEAKRNRALENPSAYSGISGRFSLADLDVTDGAGGINNKDAFVIDNNPTDRRTGKNKIDIREGRGK